MTALHDLPPGWAVSTLGDLASFIRNGLFASRPDTDPGGVPILRISSVRPGSLDMTDIRYVHGLTADQSTDFAVQRGDLLFTRYNGSRHLVGVCAMVPDHDGVLLHPDKLIRVVVPRDVAEPRYLEYWMQTPEVRHHLDPLIRTTAGQSGIAGPAVRGIPVKLAPLPEQRRIVAALEEHLSRADAASGAIAALGARLGRLRDAARNDVVRRALSATNGATRSAGEVADVQGGIQKQPARRADGDSGLPFLRVANVGRGWLDLTDVHRILVKDSELPRVLLRPGDLLVVEGNGSPDQIGRAAIWDGSISPCTHQNHLIRVRPEDSLVPEYFEMVWNAPTTVAQLKVVASSTSGLYTLSTGKVKAVQIPVPSVEVQRDLVFAAKATLAIVDLTVPALDRLAARGQAFRRALLAAAFAGKLTGQDPADEPAELLLKRLTEERASTQPKARSRRKGSVRPAPKSEPIEPVEETA